MGVQVTFNYDMWVARYPEFTDISAPLAAIYFAEASLYHRNDGTGPVNDPTIQLLLLNMVTAHVAARYRLNADGTPANPLVGRISDATEGSVTVSAEYADTVSQQQAWWAQTKYGADYWAATPAYRAFHYIRGHPRRMNFPYPGVRRWFF